MMKKNFMKPIAILLTAACVLGFSACGSQSSSSDQTTIYGKVTAVSGSKITLALGTMSSQNNQGNPPSGSQPQGTSGNQPQGNPPSGSKPQGNPPSGGQGGGQGGGPGSLTLTGKSQIITISDTGIMTKQSMQAPGGAPGQAAANSQNNANTSASLSDITVGTILKVTYQTSTGKLLSVVIMSSSSGGAGTGGTQTGETPSVTGTGAYDKAGDASNQTITASKSNQSGVRISNASTLTMTGSSIKTTGNTTSESESNFFGLNAGVLALGKSAITLKNSSIETTGSGANAAFAYGSGSTVSLENVKINTSSDSSRGLDATYGGTIKATNVNISTKGMHCAAIATDRGEGNITVSKSTAVTAGKDSPAIYSTGTIKVSDSTLTATGAQAMVIEGKNSITLTNCKATGYVNAGVMMYQSYSGDAAVGTSKLSLTGGSLTAKAGALFYITNTNAEITLNNTALTGTGTLLAAEATSRWGTSGSNGGTVKLTANLQTLNGDVTADKISSVTMALNKSVLTGTLNKAHTAKVMVLTLDASSKWNVTGTSYLTALSDSDKTLSNIKDNGNTIYYDSTNSANSWLNGKTITLSGGGTLTPVK